MAYKKQGEYDKAIKEWRFILSTDPYDADSYFNLAEVYETTGLIDEAIEHYRRYIQLAPLKDYLSIKHARRRIQHLATSAFLKRNSIQVYQLAICEISSIKTRVTAQYAA
jgi:tetratricopeptide (TPR) repeat protein